MSSDLQTYFDQVVHLAGDGHWETLIETIRRYPALVDMTDKYGRVLLVEVARFAGSSPAIEALVQAGADPDRADTTGVTPIAAAICGGSRFGLTSVAELRTLLARGASASKRADSGYPPLHWAIVNNQIEHAEVLLSHGADPNQLTTDAYPESAFAVARRLNNQRALDLLNGIAGAST